MPELAEVETVRVALKEKLVGKKIVKIDLYYSSIFENKEEISSLYGKTFKDIYRKGKYLIFVFEDCYLLAHLRMEGKFFVLPEGVALNKHMHVSFLLDDGNLLIYQDVRKFGRMHYYSNYEKLLSDLPLGPDANLAMPYLDELFLKLSKSNKPIKTLLLDQSFIAGLGNIYVDEVLYKSKIHPLKIAKYLSKEDLENILKYSKEILDKAIIYKGTTIRSYTSELGVSGSYQQFLNVHTKETDPLGHHIFKVKVGGRTSYYCPICQGLPKKFVVGITGGIATGKSNISNELRKLGFYVSDADLYVKDAYLDNDILSKLKANGFIKDSIDKKYIAQIIFSNKEKRELLNSIIHPYVIDRIKNDISNHEILFIDVPLLFELGLDKLCDAVILAYVPYEIELSRLMERDHLDEDDAKKRISSQMELELKRSLTNYIIDTRGSFEETQKGILKVLEEIINGIYL